MSPTWPQEIVDFEAFLESAGLVCLRRADRQVFGNKILECRGASIAVRAVSDRGVWRVDISDPDGVPSRWYYVGLLRDLLLGPGEDTLSLTEEIEIVEANWHEIISRFSPAQREHTHLLPAVMGKERAKRLFPGLYSRGM